VKKDVRTATRKILRETKYRKSKADLKGFKISAEMKKHKSERNVCNRKDFA